MTKIINYARIFVGEVARWPRDRQLEKCKEIDPDLNAIYESNEFDLYVRNLRRDEVALVARLVAIAEKIPTRRPGAAFVERLMMLMGSKAAYIHDAQTGIKSIDGQLWVDLVVSTYGSITKGRELSSERASVIATLSHEAREPGLVADWIDKKGTPEYKAAASTWGNLNIKPAKYAISKLDDDELKTVSPSTMKRIFGTRRECLEWLNNL